MKKKSCCKKKTVLSHNMKKTFFLASDIVSVGVRLGSERIDVGPAGSDTQGPLFLSRWTRQYLIFASPAQPDLAPQIQFIKTEATLARSCAAGCFL